MTKRSVGDVVAAMPPEGTRAVLLPPLASRTLTLPRAPAHQPCTAYSERIQSWSDSSSLATTASWRRRKARMTTAPTLPAASDGRGARAKHPSRSQWVRQRKAARCWPRQRGRRPGPPPSTSCGYETCRQASCRSCFAATAAHLRPPPLAALQLPMLGLRRLESRCPSPAAPPAATSRAGTADTA